MQNLRRHFYFYIFLRTFHVEPTVSGNVCDFVISSDEGLPINTTIQVGPTLRQDKWISVVGDSKFPGLFDGIKFVAGNHLYLPNMISARIGLGVRELPQANGFAGSVVLPWQPGRRRTQTIELDGTRRDRIERLRLQVEYLAHWQHLSFALLPIMQPWRKSEEVSRLNLAPIHGNMIRQSVYRRYLKGSVKRKTVPSLLIAMMKAAF
jgi:hypothetical protein